MGRGILGTLLNASGSNGDAGDSQGDRGWTTTTVGVPGTSGPTNSGRRITAEGAQKVSAVYAARSLLERMIGAIPVLIYQTDPRTGRRTEVLQNPLYDVLQHSPNVWQTPFEFRAMLQGHAVMRGNGFAEIIPGRRGAVDQLEPIHPDRLVRWERLPDRTLRFTFNMQGGQRTLLQSELFHVRAPNVSADGVLGVSPLQYAMETVGLALAAEEHGARIFKQGARPSGVITVKNRMSEPAFKRFKADVNANYGGGAAGSGRTLVLEDGATFLPTTMSADEIQFLQLREFTVEEVARWFDIPLVLLHSMGKTSSWGSGVEQIMLAFIRNNLGPWLQIWQQAIRRDLITAPQYYSAEFDVDFLQRGDSAAVSNYLSRLVLNGILTRNEARGYLGYNPIDGLDEPLTPTNTTTSDNLPGNGGGSSDDPGTSNTGDPKNLLLGHNGGPPLGNDGETE